MFCTSLERSCSGNPGGRVPGIGSWRRMGDADSNSDEQIRGVEVQIRSVEEEIRKLEQKIERVEEQIETCSNVQEKAQLRRKEAQLRDEKARLRDEKARLLAKEEQLREQILQGRGHSYHLFSSRPSPAFQRSGGFRIFGRGLMSWSWH